MGKKRSFSGKSQRQSGGPRASLQREPIVIPERKPPVQYGAPVVVLEDQHKQTFVFVSGAWSPFEMSIAECRESCRVTELSQKIKGMTRYEVRRPV